MDTIGLIAAMTQERDALLRCEGGWKKIAVGNLQGYQKEINGRNCLLLASGMGIRRAEDAARNLCEATPVETLISFGIAGAVEDTLSIGDVILVDTVCQFEGGQPSEQISLARWSQPAYHEAEHRLVSRGAHVYYGTAITTGGAQMPIEQLCGINHPVLEMETMGIARVAKERGVPFLAVRSISDGPSAPIPFDLGEMMDDNANMRIGKLLGQIVRHPKMVSGLGRMMRNSRTAEENAAIALTALLSIPLPGDS